MLIAWISPRLEGYCTSGARLRSVAGDQTEAAEDLLYLVTQAPQLGSLAAFRSIRMDVQAGTLALSIEEVDMHARPLSPAGVPRSVSNRASLLDHATTDALLIRDLHIRGESILRRTS